MSAKLANDPDIRRLSDAAFRYWVLAIAEAALMETDGVFEAPDRRRAIWTELIDGGRFIPTDRPGVFIISGYERWQISKAELEERREQARERSRRFRSRKKDPGHNAVTRNARNAFVTTSNSGFEVKPDPNSTSEAAPNPQTWGEFLDENPEVAKRWRRDHGAG